MKTDLTSSELKKHLSYNSETGQFIWLAGLRAGKVAGCKSSTTGYIHIKLNQYQYLAHRLAWLYCKATWPEFEIDHRDRCRSNNKIENLREATPSQNRANTALRSTNKSGFRGVIFEKKTKKYRADIKVLGKQTTLGYFDDPADAARCYEQAALKAHGEFFLPAAARQILSGEVK